MQNVPRDLNSMPSHAHWCAAYWGRALTQIAAQGSADRESVSVRDIIVQFLNMNRIAAEMPNKTEWNYDKKLWQGLSERIKRRERNIPIQEEFCRVTEDKKSEIKNRMDRERTSSTQQTQQQSTMRQPEGPGKGKASYQPNGPAKGRVRDNVREEPQTPDVNAPGKGKGKDGKGKKGKDGRSK